MDDREYRRAETEARRSVKTTGSGRAGPEDALARYLMAEAYDEGRREETEAEADRKSGKAAS